MANSKKFAVSSPTTKRLMVVRDVWRREVKEKVRVVIIEGIKEPVLLVSTNLSLSACAIIEMYASRFSIEIAIRDLKQHFGIGDYQTTTTLAIIRFVHLCCLKRGSATALSTLFVSGVCCY